MTAFLHIIERGGIHFVSSAFLVLGFFFSLKYWIKRNAKVSYWISPFDRHLLVTCGLLVFALLPLREPFDVAIGQSWVKALTDIFSWFCGASVSVWGLVRFKYR